MSGENVEGVGSLRDEAIQIAAQVWCDPTCSHKVMDVDLATVFATRLDSVMRERDKATAKLKPQSCVRGKGDPPQDCEWPMCGCDPQTREAWRIFQDITDAERIRLVAQVDAWTETARLAHVNEAFWRDLVHQTGRIFGGRVYVQDDGGIVPEPLGLRVPEVAQEVMDALRHTAFSREKDSDGSYVLCHVCGEQSRTATSGLDVDFPHSVACLLSNVGAIAAPDRNPHVAEPLRELVNSICPTNTDGARAAASIPPIPQHET